MYSIDDFKVIITDGEIDLTVPKYLEEPYEYYDIHLHDTNTYIGYIWYDSSTDKDVISYFGNVGYGIEKEHRGSRYALKALKLLKEIMIERQIKSMIFNIEKRNVYSKNVAKEMGARKVRTIKIDNTNSYARNLYTQSNKKIEVYEYKLQKKGIRKWKERLKKEI